MTSLRVSLLVLGSIGVLVGLACGGSDGSSVGDGSDGGGGDGGARGLESAGQTCKTASECYPGVGDAGDGGIVGAVTCITKVPNGYCTHVCTKDSDCCAATGECRTAVTEVCSPLENQGDQYCFLSCEDADIQKAIAANASAGYYDGGTSDAGGVADAYCQSYAGTATSCRSSGGGSKNRKICLPK